MHDKYMDSDAYFDAYTYELEQALIEQKIEGAEEKGKLKEKREMLIMLLTERFGVLSNQIIEEIEQATYDQLHTLTKYILKINDEKDALMILNHTEINE